MAGPTGPVPPALRNIDHTGTKFSNFNLKVCVTLNDATRFDVCTVFYYIINTGRVSKNNQGKILCAEL